MKVYLLLLIVIFLYNACEKPPCTESYIPGEIILTFKDSTTLLETYDLMDSLNLSILNLNNFDYYLNNNNTPIDTIINKLESKNYLVLHSYTQNTPFQTEFNLAFNNFDLISKSDWFTTVTQYQLVEKTSNISFMKFGTIKVPESEENYWIEILNEHKNITSASRNAHVCISYCQ